MTTNIGFGKSKEVRIETSTICNYNCIHCAQNTKKFTRQKTIMSMDLFKLIIDKVKKSNFDITDITFSGFGEPLIDDTIIDKIKLISPDFRVHLLTNGSKLNKRIVKQLKKAGLNDIRISVHALNKKIYKKFTQCKNKDYRSVMKGIDYLINESMDVNLSMNFIKGLNDKECIPFIKRYYYRVDNLEIWKPHNWVTAFNYRKIENQSRTCYRPFNGPIQIQIDGTVNMCCFDYNGDLELGDLKLTSLDDIYKSPAYIALRDAHLSGNLSDFICDKCDIRMDSTDELIYSKVYNDYKNRVQKTSTCYEKVKT